MKQALTIKTQRFGRFLSNMVMPNIGAFIAWGIITALFIPTGWWPNESFAKLVGPMITYLLPLLIGYTGGTLLGGQRGGVVGAITTMGVIAGASMPMFLGAMIAGPLGGLAIKKFDAVSQSRIKSGFEMLVNNFSAGIIGMLLALLSFVVIGPCVELISKALELGVKFMVEHNMIALASILVEPAKIIFLNNAINHGVFSPLGITQSAELGKSIFFLIEANPGPGLGVLLAYMFFGRGAAKQSSAGAAIIHFFGGIHEIYFPYVLMKPKLLLGLIAGGASGVFTLALLKGGLIAPASPGSFLAVLAMTPKDSYLANTAAVAIAFCVSFALSSWIIKMDKSDSEDDLKAAQDAISSIKAVSKGAKSLSEVKKIAVACDAGMGSSAAAASMLRREVKELDLEVINIAINDLDESAHLVITHEDLTPRAKQKLPNAMHMSITNFMDKGFYEQLAKELKAAKSGEQPQLAPKQPQSTSASKHPQQSPDASPASYLLSPSSIFLNCQADSRDEAIIKAGDALAAQGCVAQSYTQAMLDRERSSSTYLGEGLAMPHGTSEAKSAVIKTGAVVYIYPQGVDWGSGNVAHFVIGVAAQNNAHIELISAITSAISNPDSLAKLKAAKSSEELAELLNKRDS